jgi:hypothetical protein
MKGSIKLGAVFNILQATGVTDSLGVQMMQSFLIAVSDMNEMLSLNGYNVTIRTAVKHSHSAFASAVEATTALLSTSFSGTGAHALVVCGGSDEPLISSTSFSKVSSLIALASAQTASEFNVVNIATATDNPSLSHSSEYPYSLRTISSSAYEGGFLPKVLSPTHVSFYLHIL